MRIRVGSLEALQTEGRLVTKAGGHGVCVFWHDDRAYALDDRCPHMGFPLHRGTVEAGLVTCHWHHARFDLTSGGTLDPFADDARAFPVEVKGDDVYLVVTPPDNRVDHLRRRLAEALEGGLTLVTAKAVVGLLEAGVPSAEVVRVGAGDPVGSGRNPPESGGRRGGPFRHRADWRPGPRATSPRSAALPNPR